MDKRVTIDGNGDAQALQQAHARLNQRVHELDRRAFLTPTEQREIADLKKHRLLVKDALRASQVPPAPRAT